ncbi:MAG TPA: TrkA family potassium uptake protein [Labilithrix sp.]|nr:TrkA family potassium uptake protein [Labilithrix sp.]
MKILITGAGRGGLSLAVHLQGAGHDVTVIERDVAITQRAANEHGLVVLVGDATSSEVLEQADPRRADAVLAMLHRDADNLAVAMLARKLGAKRVMVRMRDPAYREVYESAGVRQILSETEILVGALATAVELEAVRHSMVLGSGAAIAVEIEVLADAWVVGRAVSEIAQEPSFPASCVVAGMTLDGAVHAPRGGAVIEAGMQLLLVSSRPDLPAAVEFFRRPGEGR